ncbi:MAG: hypothetical protein J0H27_13995 [Xanthomonadales bacterium]|nr:hypothetical protein [Xanthomonadales bacterium]ODU92927.1 MAG: hypothetical protein ABT18_10585 [Rhodanobacter sp. SCN 66-43]OJY83717.1 MAG: hypothetical protein BGP23_13810 [Xanthomonadales bacterium 66-474]
MELEDIKRAWQEMELRQDGMAALWLAEYRDRRKDKTRSILRWSIAGQVAELAIWVVFTAWIASFWVAHREVTHWLVIGLLLHVYGVAGIWSAATQLLFLSRIYLFDAPVLTLQKRLAQLRRFRVWSTLALGLPWWCLWLLVPLAALYQWTGVDGFAAGSGWVWATMAVGVAGMGFSVWLARRLAGRPIASPWVRRIVDDMSGCNLLRASRQLDELARFDRE